VVAASICRDLDIEEDLSIFLEPVPTRADPWVRAEADAAAAADMAPDAPDGRPGGPSPAVKGRDPP
jgi:hypothetical protein